MRFFAARLVLILLPLTTTAARMHAHSLDAPDVAAQELNRCLKLVKIAASRRGGSQSPAAIPDGSGVQVTVVSTLIQ